MKFSSGFYGNHPVTDYFNAMDPEPHEQKEPYMSDLGIKDIGMSVPMGISASNVAGIYSKIRMGAGNIEIQFPGYKSGNRNAQTPEMLGEDQRQAIREMSMANEVNFTTHASFQLMGMMGRDERGNFSITNATQDLFELKRAIDFQADIGGGSVVIHSGEFDRPMTDMTMDDETGRRNLSRDENGRLMFKQAHTQEIDAHFELLDERTSARIESVQKNKLVAHPVWKKAKKDYMGVDVDGKPAHIKEGDYIDYGDKLILNPYDPLKGRVPDFDNDANLFKVKLKSFEEFRKEAAEYNEWFKKENRRNPNYWEKRYPEEEYVKASLDSQESYARGWSLRFSAESQKYIKALKKLEEAKEYYTELKKRVPKEDQWKIMKEDPTMAQYTGGIVPTEQIDPVKLIDDKIFDVKRSLEYEQTTAASQEQQAQDNHEYKENIITPIKRLEKHGVRMYAEAAIHAMQKTKDPNDPVVVAIEHIFPERFGGHPEELKWIISKSRDKMVEMLTNPEIDYGVSMTPTEIDKADKDSGHMRPNPYYNGMSPEQAREVADKHIKATIDTGHINLWRKYWQDDPRITKDQNDEAFNKWATESINSLAKDNMVGNVHLADNYGYHDDHLAPGQGNSPIKPIMAAIKKYGYDKAITVEPGADASTDLSDFHGLMKTWKFFGSPVYGMGFKGASVPQSFGDIQHSYFGQNKPPQYVFGGYAPSNDWTLWSAIPLE